MSHSSPSPSAGISVTVEAYRELEAENRDLMRIVRELQINLDAATAGQSHECEEQVIAAIRERRARGRQKYGTTMERGDLSPAQWAQHAQEEALDFAIYLERLKRLFQTPRPRATADCVHPVCSAPRYRLLQEGDQIHAQCESLSYDAETWELVAECWHRSQWKPQLFQPMREPNAKLTP